MLPKDGQIAGHPARVVQVALKEISRPVMGMSRQAYLDSQERKALRLHRDGNLARQEAATLWDDLVAEGFLAPAKNTHASQLGAVFVLAPEARRIAGATIGTGYRHASAERALDGFIERCQQLDDPESIYPYRVAAAVLFGSHAAGKPQVGDVDLLVKLKWTHDDSKHHEQALHAFIQHRQNEGRSIPWDAELHWPYRQTMIFLRNRSRILSLVEFSKAHLELARQGPHRVVFGKL